MKNSCEFIKALNSLSLGKHTIKVELWERAIYWVGNITTMATGELTLDVNENTKANREFIFIDLKAGMVNKELESKSLIAAKGNADLNNRKEVYLKTSITDKGWTIVRYKISGAITERKRYPFTLQKSPDGHYWYRGFYVRETFDGTKYLGNYFAAPHGDEKSCDWPLTK